MQRPLAALAAREGDYLGRGASLPALDRERAWDFEPAVRAGDLHPPGRRGSGPRAASAPRITRCSRPRGARGGSAEVRAGPARVEDPVVRLEDGGALALLAALAGAPRPRPVRRRLPPDVPFLTGQRVLDCFFPVAERRHGGGAGRLRHRARPSLEQSLAKYAAADVVVYVGCGERGNEMAEVLDEFPRLVDPRTGGPLLDRTVLVVNTSNMPVAAREASIYMGFTIAEYFRDMGRSVAVMVDSTSRWAEALREISVAARGDAGRGGLPDLPRLRAWRASTSGPGASSRSGAGRGPVTIVGAVSPPGGDFSEPVTQASLRVTGALWALSADLAHRRHFPAVDWAPVTASTRTGWTAGSSARRGEGLGGLREAAMALLQRERELREVAELVGPEALQDAERLVLESARLLREGFLRQSALDPNGRQLPAAQGLRARAPAPGVAPARRGRHRGRRAAPRPARLGRARAPAAPARRCPPEQVRGGRRDPPRRPRSSRWRASRRSEPWTS